MIEDGAARVPDAKRLLEQPHRVRVGQPARGHRPPSFSNRRCHRLMMLTKRERDGTDGRLRAPVCQEQQNVGTVPDGGVGRPAVVVEQILAFLRVRRILVMS